MESVVEYMRGMRLEELLAIKTEGEARFAFMLRDRRGHWCIEDRVRTAEDLDHLVGQFAAEHREENEGIAPVSGRDFLAVEIQKYQLPDSDAEPDYEAIGQERREAAQV